MYRNEQDLEREAYLNALARKRIAARRRKEQDREFASNMLGWAMLFASMWLFSIIGYAGGAF